MKIKPTNDLLFKKMMRTTGKEYILEDFIETVTAMKLTNIRPTNPYQIESYQKEIENLNPVMYRCSSYYRRWHGNYDRNATLSA